MGSFSWNNHENMSFFGGKNVKHGRKRVNISKLMLQLGPLTLILSIMGNILLISTVKPSQWLPRAKVVTFSYIRQFGKKYWNFWVFFEKIALLCQKWCYFSGSRCKWLYICIMYLLSLWKNHILSLEVETKNNVHNLT